MRTPASRLLVGVSFLLAARPGYTQSRPDTITDPRDGYHYSVVANVTYWLSVRCVREVLSP
jgi:hypothetical protein